MPKKFLLIIIWAIILSCSKNNDFVPVYSVPPEFKMYVDTFINEAAKRGHSITINNLIIKYDSTLPLSICAESNTNSLDPDIQKIISINANIRCWSNEVELETLIFHELGHCILGRLHDNSLLPNGDPKSVMIENDLSLYSPCIYPISGCKDNFFKRTYYLDELFDPTTSVPDWAK